MNQHFFINKVHCYWEGEYKGATILFKVLSPIEESKHNLFWAAFILKNDTFSDTLKLGFTADYHHVHSLNSRGFTGVSYPPTVFEMFEGDTSFLPYRLTLSFKITQFSPLSLSICNSDVRQDSLPFHDNAANFLAIFPINRGQEHTIIMKEKKIDKEQVYRFYYSLLDLW